MLPNLLTFCNRKEARALKVSLRFFIAVRASPFVVVIFRGAVLELETTLDHAQFQLDSSPLPLWSAENQKQPTA
jgi:hypothetical protein